MAEVVALLRLVEPGCRDLGRFGTEQEEVIVLAQKHAVHEELGIVVEDLLAQGLGLNGKSRLLEQLPGRRLLRRLAGLNAAARGVPPRRLGLSRIKALKQQDPAVGVKQDRSSSDAVQRVSTIHAAEYAAPLSRAQRFCSRTAP